MAGKGKAVTPKRAREVQAWADATLRPPTASGPMPEATSGPSDRTKTPWQSDQTAANIDAWARHVGPDNVHEPGVELRANSFAPGLHRLNMAVHRASDPDDTANDLSLMPSARVHSELSGAMRVTFNTAERHYDDSHMHSHAPSQQPEPPRGPTGKPRGFQIHKVQAAAQAARGAQYNGPDDDEAN
jgi:hypothetical protein